VSSGRHQRRIAQLIAIWRATRTLAQQRDDLAFRLMGITPTDARCLEALDNGETPISALAPKCGMTVSAMTSVVDRLERRALVIRRPDIADRRRILISRTPTADSLRESIFGAVHRESESLLSSFTAAELDVIERYLTAAHNVTSRHLADLRTRAEGES
jgi:DNA-binding MarR family transcriptional regulator